MQRRWGEGLKQKKRSFLTSTLAGEGDQLLTDQKDDDQDDSKLDEDDDD